MLSDDRRAALALAALAGILYVPMAGNHGLWDPWETHYGEVARQMAARGDAISLWWPGSPIDAPEFFSKPVLTFWLEALAVRAAGLEGAAASPSEMVTSWRAEWALRAPGMGLSLLTLLSVWYLVRRLAGARAALLTALILATSAQWALVTRQAMTDLPFVAPMTVALVLGALALLTPEEEREAELPRRRIGPLSCPRGGGFLGFAALFTLGGLLQSFAMAAQLRPRLGGHAIPGVLPMIPYLIAWACGMLFAARARNRRQLRLFAAYAMCGLSTLAKGPAGLGLPALILVAYLVSTRRLRDVLKLEIPRGAIVFGAVAFPWYHAMLIRHGARFWNEFIGDNYVNRARGRHGDRGGFDYYLQWAGLGMFPWSGVASLGVVRALAPDRPSGTSVESTRQALARFALLWLVIDYAVLTVVTTKFHHYILPALPALAILGGLALDELASTVDTRRAVAGLLLVAAPVTFLCGRDLALQPARLLWLFSYDYVAAPNVGRTWPTGAEAAGRFDYGPAIWAFTVAATVLLPLAAISLRANEAPAAARPRTPVWPLAPSLAAIALLVACGPPTPSGLPPVIPPRLWLLPLGAALLALPWLARTVPERMGAVRWPLVAVGLASTLFVLDRVMLDLSPHWSQKHVLAAYYRERSGPDEKLVVFDLYWRGENFYTRNEIFSAPDPAERTAFNSRADGSHRLETWLATHAGRRVFFLVDRPRLSQVRGLLPAAARDSLRVVDESCNKLTLAVASL